MKLFDDPIGLALVIFVMGLVISQIVSSYFNGLKNNAETKLKIEKTKLEQMKIEQEEKQNKQLDNNLDK